jgi:hypothetical protein
MASRWFSRLDCRQKFVVVLAFVLVLTAVALYFLDYSWWRGSPVGDAASESSSTAPTEPVVGTAAERPPSVPGLAPGVATLLPGLENVRSGNTVSLSADLCTIVFDATQRKSHRVLYIADRPNVESPFGSPQLITSCSSADSDSAVPSLSPDALELLLKCGESFCRCRRASRSAEFGAAEPWPLPEITDGGYTLMFARFLDASRVLLSAAGSKSPPYFFFLATRSAPQQAFGPAKPIALPNCPGSMLCLQPNMLVGYGGWDNGFFVLKRSSVDAPFGSRQFLATREECGTMYGPLWIAPAEDVVFYSSQGPELSSGPRRIWMLRFQGRP